MTVMPSSTRGKLSDLVSWGARYCIDWRFFFWPAAGLSVCGVVTTLLDSFEPSDGFLMEAARDEGLLEWLTKGFGDRPERGRLSVVEDMVLVAMIELLSMLQDST